MGQVTSQGTHAVVVCGGAGSELEEVNELVLWRRGKCQRVVLTSGANGGETDATGEEQRRTR